MQHILVVEDDRDIQELLQNFLIADGYAVTSAGDGLEALVQFQHGEYDLVLLDVMLPQMDGYTVCRRIRQQSMIPVVMLTALDSEAYQLQGFDLQIDDYITKPFSMQILLCKIAAILRRSNNEIVQNQILQYQELTMDLEGRHLWMQGKEIALTQREFDLLEELLTHQGKVLTRQMLLNRLWQYDFYGDERVVDTHIKNLRKKLGIHYIETIRGVGYRVDKKAEI